ncbi:MAG: radical SAM protein [Acidobacteria bacterium]|nr:radical SAM protein [Acidobacteriota bacterium]
MPLAEIAAQARLIEAKTLVEYRELPTKRWIGRIADGESSRAPFDWTINPYRGCEFACRYCFARYTHEFMDLSPGDDFDQQIFAKQWSRSAFASELARIPRKEAIGLGTATDPYQPAERRYGITRKMLEVFAQDSGRRLHITTKSDLIRRDVDLLEQIARRNRLIVYVTVTTLDTHLARALEPKAPRPDLRLEAVRVLAAAGIPTGISVSPILPGINDSYHSLDMLARAAADAGAGHMWGNVLFLKPASKSVFFPFLQERFPALARAYQQAYAQGAFLRGEYPDMIARRVEQIRIAHGLTRRHESPEPACPEPQMALFAA